jgi:putative addiction module antidote
VKLSIQNVGDDVVFVIPAELVSQLEWGPGDILEAELVEGGLKLVRVETKHQRAMKIAREGMQKYRDALAKLAKL